MKNATHLLFLMVIFLYSPLIMGEEIIGNVVSIVDGDTIIVEDKNRTETIRLEGIDAPESHQEFGKLAAEGLKELLENKNVKVEYDIRDKYDRIIGKVYLNNQYINKRILEEGWAWHYKQYSKDQDLANAEINARNKKLGLWKSENPMAPWIFRRQDYSSKDKTPSNNLIKSDSFWVTESSKIVHNSNCRYFKKSKGRLFTREEVEDNESMKDCGVCSGVLPDIKLKQNLNSSAQTINPNAIKIGLSLSPKLAQKLEDKINNELKEKGLSDIVAVISVFGYNNKLLAIKNNLYDVMESGFLNYVDFYKKRNGQAEVILHGCYPKNPDERMFFIKGRIIAKKDSKIDFEDLPESHIIAVSEASSSGCQLQQTYLKEKGILIFPKEYTKSHSLVEDAVLNGPDNAVGFLGSFVKLKNPEKIKIIKETPATPGSVIYADTRVVKKDVSNIIKSNIIHFYLDNISEMPIRNRHLFVHPFCDNYEKFFKHYRPKDSMINFYLVIGLFIVGTAFVIYILYTKNAEKRKNKALISQMGLDIERMKQLVAVSQYNNHTKWFQALETSIKEMGKEGYANVIRELGNNTEGMIKQVVKKLDTYASDGFSILPDSKEKTGDKKFFYPNLRQYVTFCDKFENDENEYLAHFKFSDDLKDRIGRIIHLSPPFFLIYFYRNFVSHDRDIWEANAVTARQVVSCYSQILIKILESELFED